MLSMSDVCVRPAGVSWIPHKINAAFYPKGVHLSGSKMAEWLPPLAKELFRTYQNPSFLSEPGHIPTGGPNTFGNKRKGLSSTVRWLSCIPHWSFTDPIDSAHSTSSPPDLEKPATSLALLRNYRSLILLPCHRLTSRWVWTQSKLWTERVPRSPYGES